MMSSARERTVVGSNLVFENASSVSASRSVKARTSNSKKGLSPMMFCSSRSVKKRYRTPFVTTATLTEGVALK